MQSTFIFTGWVPLSLFCQKTPLEFFWFFYNTFWVFLRNLIFFSYKGSFLFYFFSVTNPHFFFAVFFFVLVWFVFLSCIFIKLRTKKKLLISYYIIIFFIFGWFYLCQGFYPQITGLPNHTSLLFFSERLTIYKLLTPLALLGVWVLVIYKSLFRKPLNGAPVFFNSWFFYFAPFLFFIWGYTRSLFLIFMISEFIVFYAFFAATFRIRKKKLIVFFFIKCFVLFCVIVKDFFIIDSPFFIFFFDWSLNASLIVWTVLWFWKIDTYINNQHPAISFFFTGFIKPWILLSFTLLFNANFQLNFFFSVCYFFYFLFFIAPSAMRVIQQTPTKAFYKGKKITMFEEGPSLVLPEPLIEHLYFNSNIFKFALTVFNLNSYTLFFFLILETLLGFDWFISLLIMQSVILFFVFYSGAMITHTLKTSDVLDLRGMFLAVHQYYWCTKYTHQALVGFLFNFIIYIFFFFTNFFFTNFFFFILCVFVFCSFFVAFERFLSTWGNIVTYFQFADYFTWDDEFWSYLSPFLRDYIFWKPITPDDFIEPAPYYFEVHRKISGRHVLLLYSFLSVTVVFYMLGLFSDFHFIYFFFYYKLCLIFILLYIYDRFVAWWLPDSTFAIMEFTYYEFATYLTYFVVLLLSVCYYYFYY